MMIREEIMTTFDHLKTNFGHRFELFEVETLGVPDLRLELMTFFFFFGPDPPFPLFSRLFALKIFCLKFFLF